MSVINVKRENVPSFLQDSEFYTALDLDGGEEIPVPADCFKTDDSVTNTEELRTLLLTLRFWALSNCPNAMLCYLLSSVDRTVNLEILAEFETQLRYLLPLRELINCPNVDRLELAIKLDNMDTMHYLLANGAEPNAACFKAACHFNRLEVLQQIITNCDKKWLNRDVIQAVVDKGFAQLVKYLHGQGFCVAYSGAAITAASRGYIELLEFYLDLQDPVVATTRVCWVAAFQGHLDCLQLACERSLFPADGYNIMEMVCDRGHINILVYLHERGEPLFASCCNSAATTGHLDILQYLHEHGCEWKANACTQAAYYGHLDCLQYLHENGCPWVENLFAVVAQSGESHTCLRYLLEHGCNAFAKSVMEVAVRKGNIDVLQVLTEFGHQLFPALCALAMRYNQLGCLVYLHENGVAWGDTNTDKAAEAGHYDCMVYAHEHGCAWGPETCSIAATYGHLTCLQYAYEHGASWDVSVYKDCSVYRDPACKAYIFEQLLKAGEVFEIELPADLPRPRRDLL